MGYYTRYSLYTYDFYEDMLKGYDGTHLDKDIAKTLNTIGRFRPEIEYSTVADKYDDPFFFIHSNTMKWYKNSEDMIKLSEIFPEIYFILYGDGEDPDDRWRTCYHAGKDYKMRGHFYYDDLPTEKQLKNVIGLEKEIKNDY